MKYIKKTKKKSKIIKYIFTEEDVGTCRLPFPQIKIITETEDNFDPPI